ncbi:MAG: hypothetical protein EG824_12450 [Deltaproteobacteria bacterium]|nr:hypothetical protein [Deltaproteobacteria bacterium]
MAMYRIFMGIIFICLASASPCLAAKEGTKLVGQVTTLLEQHDAALSAHDIKGIMQTYVAGPEIFLMGTGPGEIYRGLEGVAGAYSQFFTRFEMGSMGFSYDWVSAGSRGDVAWFSAEGKIKASKKDQTREIGFNLSGTLQKQKGKWRFVAMHFSRLGVAAESEEQAGK